jgi:hypothetical protein
LDIGCAAGQRLSFFKTKDRETADIEQEENQESMQKQIL